MDFLGIKSETATYIWNKVLELYFADADEEQLEVKREKIELVATIRFIYIILASDLKNTELGRLRLKHSVEIIDALLDKITDLVI